MPKPKLKPQDLREACLAEAAAIIERDGLEALSLREVARRLAVSHQAPYKHFASRDHLLAALVARAYAAFASALEARPRSSDPWADMAAMGEAYFAYARAHPRQYRLMFGAKLPDPADHPEMMREAKAAFGLLEKAIAALPRGPRSRGACRHDALFVWSTIHGLATILLTDSAQTIAMPRAALKAAESEALARIGAALGAPAGPP
ncbi:MAG: TetR family transcriptional regulator [Alphaproteobacteria bacterium]|nr:TetR family transcriptional regulator [Alphaproteobacteria bacterium]